jgi:hypothetical protein
MFGLIQIKYKIKELPKNYLNNLKRNKIMKKYFIKQEILSGVIYHMIYVRWFGLFESFYERWNTYETAKVRLNELKNK